MTEAMRGLAELCVSLIYEGDEVEEEGDVVDGVLGLGSALERNRGGFVVLRIDGGEAGDAPTAVRSSCSGQPWWLGAANRHKRGICGKAAAWREVRRRGRNPRALSRGRGFIEGRE